MFGPGNTINLEGSGKGVIDFRKKLMKELNIVGKEQHTNIYAYIAALFYSSARNALAILPYLTPKLKSLEVSGEVRVPFKFVIEKSDGQPVSLPEPQPPARSIVSQVVVNPIKHRQRAPITTTKRRKRRPAVVRPTATAARQAHVARLSAISAGTRRKPTRKGKPQ